MYLTLSYHLQNLCRYLPFPLYFCIAFYRTFANFSGKEHIQPSSNYWYHNAFSGKLNLSITKFKYDLTSFMFDMFSSSELKNSKMQFNQVLLQTVLVYCESKAAILNLFSFQCVYLFTCQINVCFLFDLHLIFT